MPELDYRYAPTVHTGLQPFSPPLSFCSSLLLACVRQLVPQTQIAASPASIAFSIVDMAFAGTTQKCKACDKTVYLVDQLTADSKVYHKACFRCYHCRGTLKLSNFCSFEGVLYCKPHFDQLFKRTGSLDKSFESIPKANKADRPADHESHLNSKVSTLFAGTQDKCVACKKTVYPIEKVAVDGTSYHRSCFKCSHAGCVISPSNYVAHEGRLYCRHHHSQLFREKGNFSQLDKHEHIQEGGDNKSTVPS